MESRLTLRLPNALNAKLERAATRLKRKRSEVVRLALEQYLNAEPGIRPIERVRDLLGRVESSVPDLGQNHREHLAELSGSNRTPHAIARDFGLIGGFASGKGDLAENRKRSLADKLHAKRPR